MQETRFIDKYGNCYNCIVDNLSIKSDTPLPIQSKLQKQNDSITCMFPNQMSVQIRRLN